jgi:hypothetical protein
LNRATARATLPIMKTRGRLWAAGVLIVLGLSTIGRAGPVDPDGLNRDIDELLARNGGGLTASVWLGGATGPAWLARDADKVRPTASAIKTWFLVELFAKYHDRLDDPMPAAAAALADDAHLAISHFTAAQRAEIRKELGGKSALYVAQAMMGKTKVSNVVYNAAANLITAELGGPEALTGLIHKRDPAFATVMVRRYMLRDRKVTGDNEATAAAFAALYQHVARKNLAGIDPPTMRAIRDVLFRKKDSVRGSLFNKDGALASDPLTQTRAGWWETPDGSAVVYVVLTEQPTPGDKGRTAASEAQSKTADAIVDRLAAAALEGRPK